MVTIFVEGGGNSNPTRRQCREGFAKLLEKCGFRGRMPTIRARGGRNQAFDSFVNAFSRASDSEMVMLLVDSEDPVRDRDINRTWEHLNRRDNWQRPNGADDEDVLMMTTSMETWIIADHETLREHFGQNFQQTALLPLDNLENRGRQDVLTSLERATRNCHASYTKGPKSFEVLGKLSPEILEQYLPSFGRARRILDQKL